MTENFNEEPKDFLSEEGLRIDESNSIELREAGIWSRTTGMLSVIIFALALLASVIYPLIYLGFLSGGSFVLIILLVFIAVAGVIVYSMIQFGNNMRNAIEGQDQELFEKGTGNLKLYMIILCICVAISFLSSLYNFFNTSSL